MHTQAHGGLLQLKLLTSAGVTRFAGIEDFAGLDASENNTNVCPYIKVVDATGFGAPCLQNPLQDVNEHPKPEAPPPGLLLSRFSNLHPYIILCIFADGWATYRIVCR